MHIITNKNKKIINRGHNVGVRACSALCGRVCDLHVNMYGRQCRYTESVPGHDSDSIQSQTCACVIPRWQLRFPEQNKSQISDVPHAGLRKRLSMTIIKDLHFSMKQ